MRLIINQDTILKRKAVQSSELGVGETYPIVAGQSLLLASYTIEKGHYRVVLDNSNLLNNMNTWYAFTGHTSIEGPPKTASNTEKLLQVPYFSQLDNAFYPYGSCNVTSIAMCLAYLGVKPSGSHQLEDELQLWIESKGLSRHSPHDLAKAARAFGVKDDFKETATFEQVKAHIDSGYPCVIHGYFTEFGHIIVISGYNQKGFIVEDPYGEWFASGYDRNDSSNPSKGKNLLYSYEMMRRTCVDSVGAWVHFISSAA